MPKWTKERRERQAATYAARRSKIVDPLNPQVIELKRELLNLTTKVEKAKQYLVDAKNLTNERIANGTLDHRDTSHLLGELSLSILEG